MVACLVTVELLKAAALVESRAAHRYSALAEGPPSNTYLILLR
jgi:hypothetical protein